VQENFLAVIGVDEAEAFVCVVELDLAGGHGVAFLWGFARVCCSTRIPSPESRYPGGMSVSEIPPPSRLERVLAAIIGAVIALSVLAFFAIIIGTWAGMGSADFSVGLWPSVTLMPLFGLPVGFVLIIALLIVSTRRRRGAGDHGSAE